MKFCVVLPTWMYNEERAALATVAFESLRETLAPAAPPVLFFLVRPSVFGPRVQDVIPKFCGQWTKMLVQPGTVGGTEQTLAFGTDHVLKLYPDVTHVVWMGDDALFKPDWLLQLESLIDRHPDAVAWSVYHSAHQAYHKDLARFPHGLKARTLGVSTPSSVEYDVLVRSICGHGMTFSREEWAAWGVDWRQGDWPNPNGGNTLDLHHAWARPGERWVTEKSFVQHTGKVGVHCTGNEPEYGLNF